MMRGVGDLSEFSLATRLFLKGYRWRRVDPVPWTPLRTPLASARVAVVSTAGLILPSQEPFDDGVRGGDSSFREIASDAVTNTLVDSHRSHSYDHGPVLADPNVAFPIDRMHELEEEGAIGSVSHRHFSFMGSITTPSRLVGESAPAVAAELSADAVDAVLLVPI